MAKRKQLALLSLSLEQIRAMVLHAQRGPGSADVSRVTQHHRECRDHVQLLGDELERLLQAQADEAHGDNST